VSPYGEGKRISQQRRTPDQYDIFSRRYPDIPPIAAVNPLMVQRSDACGPCAHPLRGAGRHRATGALCTSPFWPLRRDRLCGSSDRLYALRRTHARSILCAALAFCLCVHGALWPRPPPASLDTQPFPGCHGSACGEALRTLFQQDLVARATFASPAGVAFAPSSFGAGLCSGISGTQARRSGSHIEELAQVHKSPSTLDNYSRDLEDFLQAVSETPFSDVLESDETFIARYVDGLWSRPACRGSGQTSSRDKITYVTGSKLSLNTIRRRGSRDPGLLRLVYSHAPAPRSAQPRSQRRARQSAWADRLCSFSSLDPQREPVCRSSVVCVCSHVAS
jgi:hypothetical protein